MMKSMNLITRPATRSDLPDINRIIEAAIMTWNLSDRVKRLTIPTYKYNEMDLHHLEIVVAEEDSTIVGVAAWEQANSTDAPKDMTAFYCTASMSIPATTARG
jgi:hypothetical protein